MGKFKAAGGAAAATVEAEVGYSSYDEATYGVPPKGPYRCVVKRLEATETGENSKEPGQPMVRAMVIIDEPAGTKKAKYNGYIMNLYRVATEEQAGRMNQFLQALAGGPGAKASALIKSFWTVGGVTDDNDLITKIGTMKFDKPEGLGIGVNTRHEVYQDEKRLVIASVMPIGDMPPAVPVDEDDEDDAAAEPDDEAGEPEADSEEVEERREELQSLTLAGLKKEAKGAGLKIADYKNLDQDALVELIIDTEFPIDDEDADADDDGEADAEANDEREAREEELGELTLPKLKTVAKGLGMKLAEYRNMDEEELVSAILAIEFPAEEEAEEETGDDEANEERDERQEELEGLTKIQLKKAAKEAGAKIADYKALDEAGLVDLILGLEFPDAEADEDADPDDDEDEEEPPAKPAATKRRGAAGTATATTSKPARRGARKDEPPF